MIGPLINKLEDRLSQLRQQRTSIKCQGVKLVDEFDVIYEKPASPDTYKEYAIKYEQFDIFLNQLEEVKEKIKKTKKHLRQAYVYK